MNKNMNILAVCALVMGLILISGCTAPGTAKDGKTVLLNSLQKTQSITSYESGYATTINVGGMAINLNAGLWSKGADTRADLSGTLMGIPIVMRYYNVAEESFSCTQTQSKWTCKKGEGEDITSFAQPPSMNAEDQTAILEMIQKGALVISTATMEKTIAERKCDTVDMTIDIEKLAEVQAQAGMTENLGSLKDSNVTKVFMSECLDQETGGALYFKMSMNATSPLGGGMSELSFEMTATKYVPNAAISADVFTLPAEVTEEE